MLLSARPPPLILCNCVYFLYDRGTSTHSCCKNNEYRLLQCYRYVNLFNSYSESISLIVSFSDFLSLCFSFAEVWSPEMANIQELHQKTNKVNKLCKFIVIDALELLPFNVKAVLILPYSNMIYFSVNSLLRAHYWPYQIKVNMMRNG